jgi:aminoglycoside phosphotransferase (APT) family kinase protein
LSALTRQQPGERVGIGRTAEVFAWGDGEIVKVLRPEFPDVLGENEAAVAARVTGLGLAAPRFVGTERVDGRFALVYERLRGPSMLDELTRRPWSIDGLAREFAALHAQMHDASGAGLPDIAASLARQVGRAAELLGAARADAVLARLDGLAGGGAICHGDMHPGNVIMVGSGPVVIDWLSATSGPPEADLARSEFLLTGSAVPGAYPRVQRVLIERLRRRFASRYAAEYRRLRTVDEGRLDLWRMPVLAARLAEGIEAEREAILARIDGELARDL